MKNTPFEKFKKLKNPTQDNCLEILGSVLSIGFNEEQDEVIYFKKLYNSFPEAYRKDQNFNELAIIKSNGKVFSAIEKPTKSMILNSLPFTLNSWIVGHIPDNFKTEEFFIEIVKINPQALVHIENPSYKVCSAALKEDVEVFKEIENPTPEICLLALSIDETLYTSVTICPNPDYKNTVSNLKKMSVVGKNQQLVKETIKRL